jgi:hypothetical protein
MQCAKLLQCMGGVLGTLGSAADGQEALATIDAISMRDVRKVIKLLIDQGLDSKKPERATYQECIVAFEASLELLSPVQETSRLFGEVTLLLKDEEEGSRELLHSITNTTRHLAGFAGLVVAAHESKAQAVEKGTSPVVKPERERAEVLKAEVDRFVHVLHSGEPAGALDCFFDSGELIGHAFIICRIQRSRAPSRLVPGLVDGAGRTPSVFTLLQAALNHFYCHCYGFYSRERDVYEGGRGERRLFLSWATAEKDSKESRKATRSIGNDLEESATRALMHHRGEGRGGRGEGRR